MELGGALASARRRARRSAAETTCTRVPADEAELVVLTLGLLKDVDIREVGVINDV